MYGIAFLIDNTQLGLVATDKDSNIHVYMFQPQARESLGGKSCSQGTLRIIELCFFLNFQAIV